MSDFNNNNEDWSKRNWQDAGNFGGARQNGGGLFGGSQNGGLFGNNGQNADDPNRGFGGLFQTNNSGKVGGGWMQGRNSSFVIIIVLIIVIIYTFYTQMSMNASITQSTVQRVKIESSFDSRTDPCFFDEYGAVEEENALRNAAKTFHDRTGVIPYVYFMQSSLDYTEADLNAQAETFYHDAFQDEDHFVIFFDPLDPTYVLGTYVGENARSVLDAEALQIFKDYLDKFYAARQTNNQTYMANTYRYASERMMSTSPYSTSTVLIGVIAIVILIVVILYSAIKKKKPGQEEQKIERM